MSPRRVFLLGRVRAGAHPCGLCISAPTRCSCGMNGRDFLFPIFSFQFSNFSPLARLLPCSRPSCPLTHATKNRYNQSLTRIGLYEVRNIMKHNLPHTISLLARTPAALDALLRDLPEAWTLRNEGENTWSAFDVVGHLVHAERTDWMPRASVILQFGHTEPFDPFDRWRQERQSQSKSLAQLLDE